MKYMNKLSSIMLSLLLLCSCSVKENRTSCPCWLKVFVSTCHQYCNDLTISTWGESQLFSDRIALGDHPNYYEKTVPKGFVRSVAYTGVKRGSIEDGRYLIERGNDADSLYSHSSMVDCRGEFATDTVRFHKQFARVFIKVEMEEGDNYPYEFIVRSNVCGMDMKDQSLIFGEFEKPFSVDEYGETVFSLPRQEAESDVLQIHMYRNGILIKTIPLAKQVREAGYSWLTKDLKDIYLGIDYAEAMVSISVQGWEDGKIFDITI